MSDTDHLSVLYQNVGTNDSSVYYSTVTETEEETPSAVEQVMR